MNTPLLVSSCVLGLCVLLSYYVIFRRATNSGYFQHPFWLGLPKEFIIFASVLQCLAAIGFCVALTSWVKKSPEGGLLSLHPALLPLIVSVLLVASIAWAPLTDVRMRTGSRIAKIGASASLTVTAIGSILLVAGASEETNPRWSAMIGTLLFAIVTVICEGVIYNARFIKYH